MKKNVLYWFKTDLRLHDNEPMSEALSNAENIYFVYVHDPKMDQVTSFGTKKMGAFRQSFLNECLMDLDAQLKTFNHSLIIFSGDATDELTQLCKAKNIADVYTQAEHFPEEKARVHDVQQALQKENISLQTSGERTLLSQKDLPFLLNDLPNSFTPFRQKVESTWKIRPCAEIPNLTSISTNEIDLNNYKISPSAEKEIKTAIPFKGGETAALARLHEYLYQTHNIKQYKETRNGLIGPDYSSKFSLWLAHGAISPRKIYHSLKEYEATHGANESTYWMVFELLWRDYFHFAMQKTGSQLFQWSGVQSESRSPIPLNKEKFENWKNGTTGQPFIDANMRELKATGFMSNRGRQNVASFWVHEYAQDWRYGAAYFEEQLIDYDPASNWGNWAYLAGVGHDPRGWRKFNIEKQAQQYDPDDKYQDLWLKR